MAETVSDILGKGLKFEQRVIIQQTQPDKLQGTVPALIGGAHWGPVGEPTLVKKTFSDYFGDAVYPEDENDNRVLDWSGMAAEYHLKYSQLCYFTRITDGTDKAASRLLSKSAKVAELVGTGAIKNTTVTIYPSGAQNDAGQDIQNDTFVLNFDDKTKVVQIDPSTSAKVAVDVDNVNISSVAGQNIMFSIDDILVTYKILGSEADMDAIVTALRNALIATFAAKGITVTDASPYVYRMSGVSDLSLDEDTFVSGDIIKVAGDDFYRYNGTSWTDLNATTVAALTTNPADDAYYWRTSDTTAHQFDKAGGGGAGAFTALAMFTTHESATVPATFGSNGDVCRLTAADGGLQPGLIQSNGVDTWSQLCLSSALTTVAALPAIIVDDAWYYNSTANTLHQFDYASNTYTAYTFEVVNNVVFASQTWGTSSTAVVHNFPGTAITTDNTISASGSDTPINGIIASLQTGITTDNTPSGTAGLYLKTGGAWGLVSGTVTMYEDVPATPANGDFWKSNGSNKDENSTVRSYGWYKYNSSGTGTSKWEALTLLYFEMQSTVPGAGVGANGDYAEVGGDAALADITIGFDEFGRLIIATASENAGADQQFSVGKVSGDMYVELKISDDDIGVLKVGADEEFGGKISAIYSGELGNTIYLLKTRNINGYSLSVVKGDSLLGEFYNYSYTVNNTEFIGDMINNDRVCAQYVKLTPEAGVTSIPEFEEGVKLYLTGGTSGLDNLEDFRYINAIGAYKNLDLYDIDVIACPGIIGTEVIRAMQEVCEYRKDCFCITETPQSLNAFFAERFHDGNSDLRTEKLDSMYVAIYYPWVLIETDSVKLPQQWAPPTVRVLGAIAYSDRENQSMFAPPAGHKNCPVNDVLALETYLTEEDKQALYADTLDNNINPIVYNKRNGYFVDGQKTTKRGRHPFNRIRTVRTALYIKRKVVEIAPDFFWEPIDPRTQDRLKGVLNDLMVGLVAARAIKDNYTVVCDATINTDIVEADNGLIAMITWSPIKSVEKIKIISTIIDQQVATTIEI